MAEIQFQQMTSKGYHEIQQEIEDLKKQRPFKIAQLKAARALGDLSENTEYSTAKRELRHLESRMRYLDHLLTYAKIVDPKDNGTVQLGAHVTIEFTDDHSQETYQIVGKQEAEEASLNEQKLSFDSPLGKSLMHQQVGDTVNVKAPATTYQVKVKKVEL
ncbi:transcription elongation factor GreA [Limosilactobacillus sp.]|uniref:transcription elongation factor GreA n=1 Tax=Limosilactobacillus sp. TaxID=2773925 RepID=UPI00345EAC73